ncbi:TonB-dependent receptor [Undibacterium sp. SXout7W]|uniref:TonB-dependent receptor n=1 Tax=Undibacterium sp. SXout7W TaxID=3413049 RepID=UPI003BF25B3C
MDTTISATRKNTQRPSLPSRIKTAGMIHRKKYLTLCVSAAITGSSLYAFDTAYAADAAEANEAADVATQIELGSASSVALKSVTVSARKRAELIQDVPLPETVLSGSDLARDSAVTLSDFAGKAPNLAVSATNSRQTSVALRGLGKNSANEAIQSSVGLIVDGVVLTQAGMAWSNYVDLDQVEILRGPQGTLQGKNTTLGAIVITTKAPSFKPEYTFEAGYGSLNTFDIKASATGPIIDGLLAYRSSFYANEGDGPIKNIYAPLGGTWEGRERRGTRLQFLLTPDADFSARLIAHYDASNEHGNLSPYIQDPTTFSNGAPRTITYSSRLARAYFGGYTPLIGKVTADYVDLNSAEKLPVHQSGISLDLQKNWNGYTLTSISAYRKNDFNFRNDFDYTHFNIQQLSGTLGNSKQITQELRLASPLGKEIDYQIGLFAHKADSYTLSRSLYGQDAGAFYASNAQYSALNAGQLQSSLNGVFNTTETDPSSKSLAGFAQANWHVNDKANLTVGLRATKETVSTIYNKISTGGVAVSGTSLAIRQAQQGTLYGYVDAGSVTDTSTSWLINPSYQLTKDVLLYASASHGTKSGAVQLDSNGLQANVKPENSLDFELGVNSSWLDRSLFLNANIYRTKISDYQSTATIVSPTSSTGYASLLTNVGGVLVRGIELDGAWNISNSLYLNFGAAFNDPKYASYTNATCAVELNVSTPCDFTGKQVASAPKVTANIGIDYKKSLSNLGVFHAFGNESYRSRTNLATTLSDYTWQSGYSVLNGGIGIIFRDGKSEINLIGKNLLDKQYAVNLGQYSNSAGVSKFYGDPRYIGVVFKTKI